jgi:isopenicillin N synthase-like dioxygenase
MSNAGIPSVDLNDFINGTPEQKIAFVQQLGKAYEDIGFVAVKGHFLSDELSQNLYAQVQQFYGLDLEKKCQRKNGG